MAFETIFLPLFAVYSSPTHSMSTKLDMIDIKLLNAPQSGNQLGAEKLAAIGRLSPAAILRRLRADGVIADEAAVLSKDVLSGWLAAFINAQLERHQAAA
jgi:DNA-binding Lrp family transcriptional regulator